MKTHVLKQHQSNVDFDAGDVIYDVNNCTVFNVSSDQELDSLIEWYSDALNGHYRDNGGASDNDHVRDAKGLALVLMYEGSMLDSTGHCLYNFITVLHDGRVRVLVWVNASGLNP